VASCTRRGYCTLPGPDADAPRWCNRHKPVGAADTFNRLCAHAGCTTLGSFPGLAGAKLCAAHSPSKGPGSGRRAAADPLSLGAKKGGAQKSSRAAGSCAGRREERLRRRHAAPPPPTGPEPSDAPEAAGAGVRFQSGPPPAGAGSVGWIVGGRAAFEERSGLSLRGGDGGGGAGGESREVELGDEDDYGYQDDHEDERDGSNGQDEEEEEEEEEWRGRDGPPDAAAGPAAGSARKGVTWASLAPEELGASQSASALGGDDHSGGAAAEPGHVEDLVATLDAVRPGPWPFEPFEPTARGARRRIDPPRAGHGKILAAGGARVDRRGARQPASSPRAPPLPPPVLTGNVSSLLPY